MDISFITSLYRSARFLKLYTQRLMDVVPSLIQAGLSLEVLLIANDADDTELGLIQELMTAAVRYSPHLSIQAHDVPRENLYASWNRGLRLMQGEIFGFWNVDDYRHIDALLAAVTLLKQGYTLVDAPMRVVQPRRLLGRDIGERVHLTPVLYHPQIFTRKRTYGPFALHHRELYEQVGVFDEHFRIAGDIEWGGRARKFARFHPLAMPGGTFYLHTDNLSSHNDVRQVVEENIVFMRAGLWDEVRPTPDPALMRELWDTWGNPDGRAVPPELAVQLWGEDAYGAWQAWERQQRRARRAFALRRLPRALIDSLGWRPALARIGLVKEEQ
jgi:hypothetical protein